MNEQQRNSWEELVEGAKSVNLDHVPAADIEKLFGRFIEDAGKELGLKTASNSRASIMSGILWLLAGLVYLVAVIQLKH